MRMAQERLLVRGRIGDQGPAVTVARHHEARCHVLTKQSDTLGMQAVANGQGPAGVVAVRPNKQAWCWRRS